MFFFFIINLKKKENKTKPKSYTLGQRFVKKNNNKEYNIEKWKKGETLLKTKKFVCTSEEEEKKTLNNLTRSLFSSKFHLYIHRLVFLIINKTILKYSKWRDPPPRNGSIIFLSKILNKNPKFFISFLFFFFSSIQILEVN